MKKKVLQVKAFSALLDSQTSKNPAHLTHQCNMSSKIPLNTLSSSQKTHYKTTRIEIQRQIISHGGGAVS